MAVYEVLPASTIDAHEVLPATTQAGLLANHQIQNLLALPQIVPPRSLKYGERDKYNLLPIEDTLEPIVGVLFDGCEAMENHLVSRFKRRRDEVDFPEVSFDSVRRYKITRTNLGDESKRYHFSRVGDPASGFFLIRAKEGNILLRHPEQGDTPFKDDAEYCDLIGQATNFLKGYANRCGFDPEMLASKVPANPKVKKIKPERESRLRKASPVLKKLGICALMGSIYAGLPAYCIDGSLNTGHQWMTTARHIDQKSVVSGIKFLRVQKAELTSMETSLGSLCAAAIAPYAPGGNLAKVDVSNAATQLRSEDRCSSTGENTQLEVQDYREQIHNVNQAEGSLSNDRHMLKSQHADVSGDNFGLVVAGLAVGGVGDGVVGLANWIAANSLKNKRNKAK